MANLARDEIFVESDDFVDFVQGALNESDTESNNDDESVSLSGDSSELESDYDEVECLSAPRPNLEQKWKWRNESNVIKNITFTGNSGISATVSRRLGDNPSKLDVLNVYLDEYFWQQISDETNRYARTSLVGAGGDNNCWVDITTDELKAYFSLIILMSQYKKANINDYWTTRKVSHCPIFGETMARNRFKLISKYLHFSSSLDQSDKLKKIRPVLDMLIGSYKRVFTPGKQISIDESLMRFRGRLAYIQFNPKKRARFGIKFYKVCDSVTGYCYNLKIYTGKEDNVPPIYKDILVSEKVVLEVCSDLLHHGRTLYMDNWYSSPRLYLELLNKKTYAVGTLRSNRKHVPTEVASEKLRKNEVTFQSCNNMICMKWKDKKDVMVLSTAHERPDFVEVITQREKRKENPKKELKPEVVVEYNTYMNGVDKQDQQLASFPVMRRYAKGYKKIFFYLFDITLYNAYIVYNLITKEKKHFSKFRVDVAEQILQTVQLPERSSKGRPSNTVESPLRLQGKFWGHFIEKIPPTTKARPTRRCKVCATQGRTQFHKEGDNLPV